jgi:hypothetical protein
MEQVRELYSFNIQITQQKAKKLEECVVLVSEPVQCAVYWVKAS